MDGPFRLDIYKDKYMQLTIECINARGYKEKSECMISCNYYDFVAVLYKAQKSFNYILYSNGMSNGKYEYVYRQTIDYMKELKQIINTR